MVARTDNWLSWHWGVGGGGGGGGGGLRERTLGTKSPNIWVFYVRRVIMARYGKRMRGGLLMGS